MLVFEATKWGGGGLCTKSDRDSIFALAGPFHHFLHVFMMKFYLSLKALLSYKCLWISWVGIHLFFPQLLFSQFLWSLPFPLPWLYLYTTPHEEECRALIITVTSQLPRMQEP